MNNNSTSNEAGLDDGAPKFTLFSQLPAEIREQIWEEACNEPRILDLWAFPVGTILLSISELAQLFSYPPFVIMTHQRIPGVLEACQESRNIADRHYELSFGTRFTCDEKHFRSVPGFGPGAEIIIKTPPLIYVNWKVDIICPFPKNSETMRLQVYAPSDVIIAGLMGYPSAYAPASRLSRIAVEAADTGERGMAETFFQIHCLLPTHCLEEIVLYSAPSRLKDLSFDKERPIAIEFETLDRDRDLDAKLREAGCGQDAAKILESTVCEFEEEAERQQKRKGSEWKCPAIKVMVMKVTDIQRRA